MKNHNPIRILSIGAVAMALAGLGTSDALAEGLRE